jgi:hypothetical protein
MFFLVMDVLGTVGVPSETIRTGIGIISTGTCQFHILS